MATYQVQLDSQTIALNCDEALEPYAHWLLGEIAKQHQAGNKVFEGMFIQVGWSMVTLRLLDGVLLLWEPDFGSDPLTGIRADVTCTLSVYKQQREMLKLVGLEEGQPSRFDETVTVALGALEKERIAAKRMVSPKGESSWFVHAFGKVPAGAKKNPEKHYGKLMVWELLRLRPSLLSALSLPNGYAAVFDKDKLLWIENEHQEHLWEA
jgi:hypothetical protein